MSPTLVPIRAGALPVAVSLAIALAVLATPSGAGAAQRTCTAWATLPTRIALVSAETTVRPRLVGDAGCRADTADAGAVAYLRAPGQQQRREQRWDSFGSRERIVLSPGLDRPGRYRITNGSASVYDAKYERVASRWRETATTVRYGARFTGVAARHGRVTATLKHYATSGWAHSGGTAVALQRHTASGWRTVARTHATRSGKITIRHSTRGAYRLVSADTSRDWGASARV